MLFALPVLPQQVELANVALGMSEAALKAALSSSSPFYIERSSEYAGLRYLVAETEMESFAFMLLDGRVAAFSLMHILPPGQQPFLPRGQEPTVRTLRSLVIKQTWTPAQISEGDTLWLSDSSGEPLSNPRQCAPASGESWVDFGSVPAATAGSPPTKSTAGLMKPALVSYPSGCGVSVHLSETPAASEDDVVTSVRIQVLDIKALNGFLGKHR